MTLTWFLASIIIIASGVTVPNTTQVCGRDMGWLYIIPTQQIIYCKWQPIFAKYHEVWHHYYFAILSEEDRQKYNKEYKRATSYFREYSSTSVWEDFADAFAYSHLNHNKIKDKNLRKRMTLVRKLTKT